MKYHFKDGYGELIYNGAEAIQSDNEERLILVDPNPYALNSLIGSIYPVKVMLPKLISDENVQILREQDAEVSNKNISTYSFKITKGYIDWMNLEIKTGLNFDSYLKLEIDESNYLPTKIIIQNGETGWITTTLENIDLDYKSDDEIWSGQNLPKDFARYNEDEYYEGLKNKLASYVGKKLEPWSLPDLATSNQVDVSQFEGNVLLIEFWFKHCGWCVKAIPEINEIQDNFSDKPFKIIGVEFINEDDQAGILEYAEEKDMEIPILYNGNTIATKYGIRTAPTFMIIDKNSTIMYAKSTFKKEEIISMIESLL